MGIPVICSSVGGCPEIVQHLRTGILFTPNNKDEFINGVVKLIEDGYFAVDLARKAEIMVNDTFALSSMIKKYTDFYRDL